MIENRSEAEFAAMASGANRTRLSRSSAFLLRPWLSLHRDVEEVAATWQEPEIHPLFRRCNPLPAQHGPTIHRDPYGRGVNRGSHSTVTSRSIFHVFL